MPEVIRGHQRSSEVIRGHQRSSEVDLAPSLAHLDAWRELARLGHVGPGAHVPRT